MARVVLVTGASGGIGGAVARLFAQNGDCVALHAFHSSARAASLSRELNAQGGHTLAVQADLRERAQVEEMFTRVRQAFGDAEVLVNNAGVAQQKLFTDITEAEWHDMLEVHAGGTFRCCQCALPAMISKKNGRIVNVSSMWGQTGGSCEVHYSAAKAAVIGLTKALAKELGPSGITVNCVAPGVIDTPMLAGLTQEDRTALAEGTPLCRLGTPEDVAAAVYFLAGEGASFITGQVLAPNGGIVI